MEEILEELKKIQSKTVMLQEYEIASMIRSIVKKIEEKGLKL